uniref:DUF4200 domain-containing protein n=1 Tax=Cyclopterus lumpus TaxID=8103 RepID=A0A8C3G6U3_CYCLU
RQFLALPIDKKTTRIARMTTELGEQDEKIKERKNLKQIKSGTVLPKQTSIGHELMKAMRKQGERSGRLSLMEKRAEFSRLDKANKRKEKEVDRLENTLEREELQLEKLLRENEKKSVEAKIFFERKTKSKQKKEAEIKKLTAEIGAPFISRSERIKLQEVMIDYNKYKDLLFELSPPEWQEAQKAKALKVQSDGDPEDKQVKGTEESDEPELFFTDPQQILDLMTDLTEKSLFLIQNTTTVEETAKELRKSLETTKQSRTVALAAFEQQTSSFVPPLAQKDAMWDALGEKVGEVYRHCVDGQITNLNTLEKLAHIENCMALLLQGLDNLPEEKLTMMKMIMDSEQRSRYVSVSRRGSRNLLKDHAKWQWDYSITPRVLCIAGFFSPLQYIVSKRDNKNVCC